jgi:hypothetical protein
MSAAHVVVTIVGAALVGLSAYAIFAHTPFVVEPLTEYGVPRSWWPWLGTAKAAGAVGLLAGLLVPAVGVAAAIGLVLYFTGAEITVLHARSYSHVPYPLIYLVPAALVLALA